MVFFPLRLGADEDIFLMKKLGRWSGCVEEEEEGDRVVYREEVN